MADGKTYEWVSAPYGGEAPDLPPKLLELIRAREEKADRKAEPAGADNVVPLRRPPAKATPAEEAKRRYARAALDKIGKDLAETAKGRRGTALYHAAAAAGRYMAAGVLGEREIRAALQ